MKIFELEILVLKDGKSFLLLKKEKSKAYKDK